MGYFLLARQDMLDRVVRGLHASAAHGLAWFIGRSRTEPEPRDCLNVLLGGDLCCRAATDPPIHETVRRQLRQAKNILLIHRHVGNFLMLAWRERERALGYRLAWNNNSYNHAESVMCKVRGLHVGRRTELALAQGTSPHDPSLKATALAGLGGQRNDQRRLVRRAMRHTAAVVGANSNFSSIGSDCGTGVGSRIADARVSPSPAVSDRYHSTIAFGAVVCDSDSCDVSSGMTEVVA
jgi:hypothetical protein